MDGWTPEAVGPWFVKRPPTMAERVSEKEFKKKMNIFAL